MQRIMLSLVVLLIIASPEIGSAQPAVSAEIAPTGKLRVAMNAQTAVLLRRTAEGKIVDGVGFEVGKFIAGKLGVPVEFVSYSNSNAFIQSYGKGEWDLGIGARTPLVADKAEFVLDVLLTDSCISPDPDASLPTPPKSIGPESRSASGQTPHPTNSSAARSSPPSLCVCRSEVKASTRCVAAKWMFGQPARVTSNKWPSAYQAAKSYREHSPAIEPW
jgi:hypothetical protein